MGYSEVDEEAPYTLYLYSTDPGVTQWTIDWGDGNIENFAGSPSTATHAYADGKNNYVITATRTNGSGTVSAGSQDVRVKNVNPSLTVDNATVIADEGTTATNSGTFADVAADIVSVSASIGTVTQSAGVWNWSYGTADDLVQTVTITATDEDGGVTVKTFNLEVKNVDPALTVDQCLGRCRSQPDRHQQRHVQRCAGRQRDADRLDRHRHQQRRRHVELVVHDRRFAAGTNRHDLRARR